MEKILKIKELIKQINLLYDRNQRIGMEKKIKDITSEVPKYKYGDVVIDIKKQLMKEII